MSNSPQSIESNPAEKTPAPDSEADGRLLAQFDVPSQPGNERQVISRVVETLQGVHLEDIRLERLKTAVGEATMNAMEHGNHYEASIPVQVSVLASPTAVRVRITDKGGGQNIPEPQTPDLEAKLAGLQTSRGWGLFLIKNMVDEMNVTSDADHHTVELVLYLEGVKDGSETT